MAPQIAVATQTQNPTIFASNAFNVIDPDGAGPLTAAGCWPAPEYAQNMDTKQMGALGLTEAQVNAIVAYLRAMSDR